MSQRPGMRYLPVAFTTWALRGVVIEPLFPTSLIRPLVMSTVASVRGAPPVTSITVTWVRARGAGADAGRCCASPAGRLVRHRRPAKTRRARMVSLREGYFICAVATEKDSGTVRRSSAILVEREREALGAPPRLHELVQLQRNRVVALSAEERHRGLATGGQNHLAVHAHGVARKPERVGLGHREPAVLGQTPPHCGPGPGIEP